MVDLDLVAEGMVGLVPFVEDMAGLVHAREGMVGAALTAAKGVVGADHDTVRLVALHDEEKLWWLPKRQKNILLLPITK